MRKNRPQSRSDVPWSKRREIPDRQIVGAADQYEKACRLLLAQPPESGVVLPLINSAALSIELYLKSLSAERIYTRDIMMPEASAVTAYASVADHSLRPLFKAISDDVREMLIEAYDENLRLELNEDFLVALENSTAHFQHLDTHLNQTQMLVDLTCNLLFTWSNSCESSFMICRIRSK